MTNVSLNKKEDSKNLTMYAGEVNSIDLFTIRSRFTKKSPKTPPKIESPAQNTHVTETNFLILDPAYNFYHLWLNWLKKYIQLIDIGQKGLNVDGTTMKVPK